VIETRPAFRELFDAPQPPARAASPSATAAAAVALMFLEDMVGRCSPALLTRT
jgi:hypothetical protein